MFTIAEIAKTFLAEHFVPHTSWVYSKQVTLTQAENPALGTSYRVKKKGTYTFKFSYEDVDGSTTDQFYYRFSINDIPYGNIVTNTASQGLVNVSRNIPLEGNDIIRIHAWSRYNHQIEITKVRIYQNEEGEV